MSDTTINTAAAEHLIEVGILHESAICAPDPASLLEAQASEIAGLKARLDAQIIRGNNRPVELEDGESASVKETKARHDAMSVDLQLELLKSQRFIAALADAEEARTPVAAQRPLLTKEEAEKTMGRTAWERLTNAEKAKVLDIRQSDVDKLDPRDYFGRTSNSQKAHELSKGNPGLYKLLRTKAIASGIL